MACQYCVEDVASLTLRDGIWVCEVCGAPIEMGRADLEGDDVFTGPEPISPPSQVGSGEITDDPDPPSQGTPTLRPHAQALIDHFRAHADAARGDVRG